ncbi:unnamed protein product [Cuscuta campestris]|uniref:Uncharacterized protein n=1 Tax=Cuscuta campestris TaxID=132261 RepID=A0A484NDV4_9ASTE|nr:unnamed protein product [Cuscuta campestris]
MHSYLKLSSKSLIKSSQFVPLINTFDQYWRQVNLPKSHKFSDFLRKSPKIFDLYKDRKGVMVWVDKRS